MGNIINAVFCGLCTSKHNNFEESFFNHTNDILKTTDLNTNECTLFRRRYMTKLFSLRKYKHQYAIWFYVQRFLSTTLGVGIPALLSVQYYYNNSVDNPIYWATWGLSIFGGFVAGCNTIFKVDERFYLLKNIYQKLKHEGWCYILLCQKYNQLKDGTTEKKRHRLMFTSFMESVENIIDDYYKHDMDTVMYDKENPNQRNIQNPQIPYIRTAIPQQPLTHQQSQQPPTHQQSQQPSTQQQSQQPPTQQQSQQPSTQQQSQQELNTNDTYIVDIPV
jgi:hypothetical protein